MSNSEILNTFDERRHEFSPYEFTCEVWGPALMGKADRHNEIEINYFPAGMMTYLVGGREVTVHAGEMAVFWALYPHQIVSHKDVKTYYVCTIPFSTFIEWQLPEAFVNRLMRGEVLTDEAGTYEKDAFETWVNDVNVKHEIHATALEIHARMLRMADSIMRKDGVSFGPSDRYSISLIGRIAIHIAKNYNTPIKISDIGREIGIHPDYANHVFKKSFGYTLSEHILKERTTHAQRKLLTTKMPITEIAFDCGFNSVGRFNKAFKKINGCTPREYRKSLLQNASSCIL